MSLNSNRINGSNNHIQSFEDDLDNLDIQSFEFDIEDFINNDSTNHINDTRIDKDPSQGKSVKKMMTTAFMNLTR